MALEVWIDGRVVRRHVTDDTGRLVIPLPRERFQRLAVTAQKRGLAPMRVDLRLVTGPEIEIPRLYTLTMARCTSIGGIVRDDAGRPIEGVTVAVRQLSRPGQIREMIDLGEISARTDARGRWHIDVIPDGFDLGDLRFTFSHRDFLGRVDAPPMPPGGSPGHLRTQSGVTILRRGIEVSGRVLDRKGRPIAGASVRLGARPWSPLVETEADGRFRFLQASKGVSFFSGESFLTVEAAGHAPEARPVTVREGLPPVEFRLGPGRTIRGRIVDSQGRPIAAASVSLARWNGPPTLRWRSETDTEGRFLWDGAPSDQLTLNVERDGYRAAQLSIEPRKNYSVLTLAASRPLRIRGTVRDAETGVAIESFTVVPGGAMRGTIWFRAFAKTYHGGRYDSPNSLGGAGPWRVRIEAKGYVPATSPAYPVDGGDRTFDARLKKGEWLEGVVRGPDGQPLADTEVIVVSGGRVSIVDGRDNERDFHSYARTGADGRFSLPPPDGLYRIVALHDSGYAEVTDRQWAERRALVVAPWGRIEGTLRAGGKPLAHETVIADFDDEPGDPFALRVDHESRVQTDDNGHFVITKVGPGEARVYWQRREVVARKAPSRYYQPVFVNVIPGQTVRVDLADEGGRPLVGRVVLPGAAGEPLVLMRGNAYLLPKVPEVPFPPDLAGADRREWLSRWRLTEAASVYRHRQRGFAQSLNVKEDGSFRVDEVQAGTYELHIRVAGHVELIRQVVVPDTAANRAPQPVDLGSMTLEKSDPAQAGDLTP